MISSEAVTKIEVAFAELRKDIGYLKELMESINAMSVKKAECALMRQECQSGFISKGALWKIGTIVGIIMLLGEKGFERIQPLIMDFLK
jgi:hypothetical protein